MSVTTEQAAAWFADRAKNTPMPGAREMFEIAAVALREKAEREDPKPLTLEELRQMDGEPVWIKADYYGIFADVVKISGRDDGDNFVGVKLCYRLQENGYGKTWIAYRHKPKEVTRDG